MVIAQGGDVRYIDDTALLLGNPAKLEVVAQNDGYISQMDTEKVGIASLLLGAGRQTKEDKIDYFAGITLHCKTGDKVTQGQKIATLFTTKPALFEVAEKTFRDALTFSAEYDENSRIPIIIDTLKGEK
jgi:pyrimidine-nucleoside phosphorylase